MELKNRKSVIQLDSLASSRKKRQSEPSPRKSSDIANEMMKENDDLKLFSDDGQDFIDIDTNVISQKENKHLQKTLM